MRSSQPKLRNAFTTITVAPLDHAISVPSVDWSQNGADGGLRHKPDIHTHCAPCTLPPKTPSPIGIIPRFLHRGRGFETRKAIFFPTANQDVCLYNILFRNSSPNRATSVQLTHIPHCPRCQYLQGSHPFPPLPPTHLDPATTPPLTPSPSPQRPSPRSRLFSPPRLISPHACMDKRTDVDRWAGWGGGLAVATGTSVGGRGGDPGEPASTLLGSEIIAVVEGGL